MFIQAFLLTFFLYIIVAPANWVKRKHRHLSRALHVLFSIINKLLIYILFTPCSHRQTQQPSTCHDPESHLSLHRHNKLLLYFAFLYSY